MRSREPLLLQANNAATLTANAAIEQHFELCDLFIGRTRRTATPRTSHAVHC